MKLSRLEALLRAKLPDHPSTGTPAFKYTKLFQLPVAGEGRTFSANFGTNFYQAEIGTHGTYIGPDWDVKKFEEHHAALSAAGRDCCISGLYFRRVPPMNVDSGQVERDPVKKDRTEIHLETCEFLIRIIENKPQDHLEDYSQMMFLAGEIPSLGFTTPFPGVKEYLARVANLRLKSK